MYASIIAEFNLSLQANARNQTVTVSKNNYAKPYGARQASFLPIKLLRKRLFYVIISNQKLKVETCKIKTRSERRKESYERAIDQTSNLWSHLLWSLFIALHIGTHLCLCRSTISKEAFMKSTTPSPRKSIGITY